MVKMMIYLAAKHYAEPWNLIRRMKKKKITEQLAQLPDIPEKTQLTERLQRMMWHA